MLPDLKYERVASEISPIEIEAGTSLFSGPSFESQPVNVTAKIAGYVLEEQHMSEHGKMAVEAGFLPVMIKHEGGFELVYMAAKAPKVK